MLTEKTQLGNEGEEIACNYLKERGYRIIERNYRKPWGEIDIIAKVPNKTLVFVEVKTMRQISSQANSTKELLPEDQLTVAKHKKMSRTAALYTASNPHLISESMGWRMDLIAISFSLDENKTPDVRHYENI